MGLRPKAGPYLGNGQLAAQSKQWSAVTDHTGTMAITTGGLATQFSTRAAQGGDNLPVGSHQPLLTQAANPLQTQPVHMQNGGRGAASLLWGVGDRADD